MLKTCKLVALNVRGINKSVTGLMHVQMAKLSSKTKGHWEKVKFDCMALNFDVLNQKMSLCKMT